MTRIHWKVLAAMLAVLVTAPATQAQRARARIGVPDVGYVYPAGGQRGSTVEVTIGGQRLDAVDGARVTGQGIEATVVKHIRPLTQRQINELVEKLKTVRQELRLEIRLRRQLGEAVDFTALFNELAAKAGVSPEQIKALEEFRKIRNDPKRQANPQIAEKVVVKVEIPADTPPGQYELRLQSPNGVSNPLRFQVSPWPEVSESEPNNEDAQDLTEQVLPLVINGQVTPGDVDRFRFRARKGQRLVAATSARELIPYLADAVPGWFQATLALYDAAGNEVAYADDFRFQPDPILCYEIPADGQYVLEIKDAIYRGRDDFVYRIVLGEIPYVTSVFPLGAQQGDRVVVDIDGWNLPRQKLTLDIGGNEPGVHALSLARAKPGLNRVLFAIGSLPDLFEVEPNSNRHQAQRVQLGVVVNGRIDEPGDWDVFRFQGRAGEQVIAEVMARRVGSPLDSVLRLTDASGRQLAVNDDHEDKGAGLITHQADSLLQVTLPADGTYYVHLGDMQQHGGNAYAYRLRISRPQPDFRLRVVPSCANVQPGATVPIDVYALRRDGFAGDIQLRLAGTPPGFRLSGAWIPAGQDSVRLTLTAPARAEKGMLPVRLEGIATIGGTQVRRIATAADDLTQAFIYHHLVPAEQWVVAVGERRRFIPPVRSLGQMPVKLVPGKTTQLRFSFPRLPILNQLKLELSDPPEGLAIEGVSSDRDGLAVAVHADAEKAEAGLKGNLLLAVFVERSFKRPDGGKTRKRRIPVGTLPAVPFEIVAADHSSAGP